MSTDKMSFGQMAIDLIFWLSNAYSFVFRPNVCRSNGVVPKSVVQLAAFYAFFLIASTYIIKIYTVVIYIVVLWAC